MALWVCLACTTRFAVGVEQCPHCESTDHVPEEDMPKITKQGGVSYPPEVAPDPGTFAETGGLAGETAPVPVEQAAIDDDYDPAEYTVAEVNTYLDQAIEDGNLDEVRRVLDAERTTNGGKGRAGILSRTVPDGG